MESVIINQVKLGTIRTQILPLEANELLKQTNPHPIACWSTLQKKPKLIKFIKLLSSCENKIIEVIFMRSRKAFCYGVCVGDSSTTLQPAWRVWASCDDGCQRAPINPHTRSSMSPQPFICQPCLGMTRSCTFHFFTLPYFTFTWYLTFWLCSSSFAF